MPPSRATSPPASPGLRPPCSELGYPRRRELDIERPAKPLRDARAEGMGPRARARGRGERARIGRERERENALGLAKGTGHHIALDRTPRSAVLAGGGAGCDLAEDAEPRDVQRHPPSGVETRALGLGGARNRSPQLDVVSVPLETRRVARWAPASVGRCCAEPSPPVQGRVGRCPTGSKSPAASRLKRRCSSACHAPSVPLRSLERRDRFAEKLAEHAATCAGAAANALRRESSRRSNGAELPHVAPVPAARAVSSLPTFAGGFPCVAIDTSM